MRTDVNTRDMHILPMRYFKCTRAVFHRILCKQCPSQYSAVLNFQWDVWWAYIQGIVQIELKCFEKECRTVPVSLSCAIVSLHIIHPSTLYIFIARFLAILCTVQSSLKMKKKCFIKLLGVFESLLDGLKESSSDLNWAPPY